LLLCYLIKKLSSVSFFCPAYYDEKNLPELIPRVFKFLSEIADKFEIIIIEDGSPDKTGAVADGLARHYPGIKVIHHSCNLGYGATLKEGFRAAGYDYIIYTDGDNQYDIFEIKPHLFLLKEAAVLSGYVTEKAVTTLRKFQSLTFNWLVATLFSVKIKDINCALKVYKRRVLENIEMKSNSAFIDAEMLIKSQKAGFLIAQFPVTHYRRQHGLAGGSRPGLIFQTIKDMIKFRLGLL